MKKSWKYLVSAISAILMVLSIIPNSNAFYSKTVEVGSSSINVNCDSVATSDYTSLVKTAYWNGDSSNSSVKYVSNTGKAACNDVPILVYPGDSIIFRNTTSNDYQIGFFLKLTDTTSSEYYYIDTGYYDVSKNASKTFTVGTTYTLNGSSVNITSAYLCFNIQRKPGSLFGNTRYYDISDSDFSKLLSMVSITRGSNYDYNYSRKLAITYHSENYDTSGFQTIINYGEDFRLQLGSSIRADELLITMSGTQLDIVENGNINTDNYTYNVSTGILFLKNITGPLDISINFKYCSIQYNGFDASGLITTVRHANSLDLDLSTKGIDSLEVLYVNSDGTSSKVPFNDGDSGNTYNELTGALHVASVASDMVFTNTPYIGSQEDIHVTFNSMWVNSGNSILVNTIDSNYLASSEAFVLNPGDTLDLYENDGYQYDLFIAQNTDGSGYHMLYESGWNESAEYRSIPYSEFVSLSSANSSYDVYVMLNFKKINGSESQPLTEADMTIIKNRVSHKCGNIYSSSISALSPSDCYTVTALEFQVVIAFLCKDENGDFELKYTTGFNVIEDEITINYEEACHLSNVSDGSVPLYAIMAFKKASGTFTTAEKMSILGHITHTNTVCEITPTNEVSLNTIDNYEFRYLIIEKEGFGYKSLFTSSWSSTESGFSINYIEAAKKVNMTSLESTLYVAFVYRRQSDASNGYSSFVRSEMNTLEGLVSNPNSVKYISSNIFHLLANDVGTMKCPPQVPDLENQDEGAMKDNPVAYAYNYRFAIIQQSADGYEVKFLSSWYPITKRNEDYRVAYNAIVSEPAYNVDTSKNVYFYLVFENQDGTDMTEEDYQILQDSNSISYTHKRSEYDIYNKQVIRGI